MLNEKYENDHSQNLESLKNELAKESAKKQISDDEEASSFMVYTIDAFAKPGGSKTGKTGNPAGFVDLRGTNIDLPEEVMKAIAKAVGFSETAFIRTSKHADFSVRFFTPSDEVDLCGHATIGLYAGLFKLGLVEAGSYSQKTKAGTLKVIIDEEGKVLMEQAAPILGERYTDKDIALSLGLDLEDLHPTLPIQAVSTGLLDLMIPLKDRSILEKINKNDEAVTKISQKYGVVGYHVFAVGEPQEDGIARAYCRNFAPLYAIPEEAATGTSSGALAAYMQEQGVCPAGPQRFKFRQGVEMGCPSVIEAMIDEKGTVWVGGSAANLSKRVVTL